MHDGLKQNDGEFLHHFALIKEQRAELKDFLIKLFSLNTRIVLSADTIIETMVLNKINYYLKPVLVLEEQGYSTNKPKQCFRDYLQNANDEFFTKYPLAAKIVNSHFKHCKAFLTQLLNDLQEDYALIKREFNLNADFLLSHIHAAGDIHEAGKCTLILTWHHPHSHAYQKLIYKPRKIIAYKLWNHLLEYFSEHTRFTFKTFKTIISARHLWAEYVPHRFCESHQLAHYYEHLGALFALAYVLNGNDLHAENMIAHGEHPVFIDLENLFQGRVLPPNQVDHFVQMQSVLGSAFLPTRIYNPQHVCSFDPSPFRNPCQEKSIVQELSLAKNIQCQLNLIKRTSVAGQLMHNLPHKEINPLDFAPSVLKGFQEMYREAYQHRAYIQTELHQLQQGLIRWLAKPTYFYANILNAARHPKLLGDLSQWLKFINTQLNTLGSTLQKALEIAEVKGLDEFCIPSFWLDQQQRELQTGAGETLSLAVTKTGEEVVNDTLTQRLNHDDLLLQKFCIAGSFYCGKKTDEFLKKTEFSDQGINALHDVFKFDDTELSRHTYIKLLLNIINSLKMQDAGHHIGWPTVKGFGDNSLCMSCLDLSLGAGTFGFLTLYAALTQLKMADPLEITRLLSYCRTKISHNPQNKSLQASAGGMYGALGGGILSLAITKQILGIYLFDTTEQTEELLTDLMQHAQIYLTQDINKPGLDAATDLLTGQLGTLAALANAEALLQSPRFKSIIAWQEYAPLAFKKLPKNFTHYLRQYPYKYSFGQAHGITGIMYAAFLTQNFAYIETQLDDYCTILNYVLKGLPLDWCKGLSGIILSLLPMHTLFPKLKNTLTAAIQQFLKILHQPTLSIDFPHLCHGAAGHLEVLLQLKLKGYLEIPQYEQLKNKLITQMIKSAFTHTDQYHTGLLSGYAGQLYQLLRLENPTQLPSLI